MWPWPTLKETKTPAASRKGQCLKSGRRTAVAGGSAGSSAGHLPGRAGSLPTTSGRNPSFPALPGDPAVPAGLPTVFKMHLNLSISTPFQGRRPLRCWWPLPSQGGECLVQRHPVAWGLVLLLWHLQKSQKPQPSLGRNHVTLLVCSRTHPPRQRLVTQRSRTVTLADLQN